VAPGLFGTMRRLARSLSRIERAQPLHRRL
jgi:hypothetical protein